MLGIEATCTAILVVYLLASGTDRPTLERAAGIMAGAWLAEDSCIRAYGFYQYTPGWHLWLDRVPLMIVLIWPAVVMSARRIATAALGTCGAEATPLAALTGAIVTFDAALIEPIAVHANLWSWNEPGIFGVPPIGILGWGFYAAVVTWLDARPAPVVTRRLLAPMAALLTHAALLLSWWGALRWVARGTLSPALAMLFIGVVSVGATVGVVRTDARLAAGDLFARGVATLFFGALLARGWDGSLALYASAFTLPHLVLCGTSAPRKSTPEP